MLFVDTYACVRIYQLLDGFHRPTHAAGAAGTRAIYGGPNAGIALRFLRRWDHTRSDDLPAHWHMGSVPRMAALMMAETQPTPAWTTIAIHRTSKTYFSEK